MAAATQSGPISQGDPTLLNDVLTADFVNILTIYAFAYTIRYRLLCIQFNIYVVQWLCKGSSK